MILFIHEIFSIIFHPIFVVSNQNKTHNLTHFKAHILKNACWKWLEMIEIFSLVPKNIIIEMKRK